MEIVLTAHPTQVNRRTLQYKFTRIATFLERYERSETSTYDKEQVLDELVRFIHSVPLLTPYSKSAFPLAVSALLLLCVSCFSEPPAPRCFPQAREILSLWQTDELRRRKPTPLDEARGGLHIIEQSLWVRVSFGHRARHSASASSLQRAPV